MRTVRAEVQVTTEAEAKMVQQRIDEYAATARLPATFGANNLGPNPIAAEPASASRGAPATLSAVFARGLPPPSVTEFALPAEYSLMRDIPYERSDVNRYPAECRPKKLRPSDIQVCQCRRDEAAQGTDEYCCGAGCINRKSHILCDPRQCPCRGNCMNRPFNLRQAPGTEVKLTDNRHASTPATACSHVALAGCSIPACSLRASHCSMWQLVQRVCLIRPFMRNLHMACRGYGLFSAEDIPVGAFVVEYTGEVVTEAQRLARMAAARQRGAVHFYIMELQKALYIDAEQFGSRARFMNSSCLPNCETQKWRDASTGAAWRCSHCALRVAIMTSLCVDLPRHTEQGHGGFGIAANICLRSHCSLHVVGPVVVCTPHATHT